MFELIQRKTDGWLLMVVLAFVLANYLTAAMFHDALARSPLPAQGGPPPPGPKSP